MDYYEFKMTYGGNGAADAGVIGDVLAAVLAEIGFESFVADEGGMRAYIPAPLCSVEALDACLQAFPLEGVRIGYDRTLIEDRDWNEVWERNYFRPVRIGDKCLIRAPFHPAGGEGVIDIVINPKMAFGTGNHETTRLMIEAILALPMAGREVLDAGCGTAVLAILAARRGAGRVVAIDVDEWAYANALENCALNGTTGIRVVRGDAAEIARAGAFDYILANINRNVLLHDIRRYAMALKRGGSLCMSGFYVGDTAAVDRACREQGLAICAVAERNGWVAVRAEWTDGAGGAP
ncbi:MAG: 50S ribosomal protein L11 methyltransferase [Tannerella sp.]|nr:50S ribosomal protein L11 methyltransferase [Tannerella sp.]